MRFKAADEKGLWYLYGIRGYALREQDVSCLCPMDLLERAWCVTICPPHAAQVAVQAGRVGARSFVRSLSGSVESHERDFNGAWELHRSQLGLRLRLSSASFSLAP